MIKSLTLELNFTIAVMIAAVGIGRVDLVAVLG
jgi:hypothetical protein